MSRYLVDTDVLVDDLRGAARFVLDERDDGAYSVLTRCELFAGRHVDEDSVRYLLAPMRELGVDRQTAERAGRIRRTTGIALADAVIAATALQDARSVLTRNRRRFERVAGLDVQTPRDQ